METCFVCGENEENESKLVPAYGGFAHQKCLKDYESEVFQNKKELLAKKLIESTKLQNRALEDLLKSCSEGSNFRLDTFEREQAFKSPTMKTYYALKTYDAPIDTDTLYQILSSYQYGEMDRGSMNKSLRHLEKLGYAKKSDGYWYNIR